MSTTTTLTARQWAQLIGLALVAVATILTVVAVVLPMAALAMAAALLVAGVTLAAQRVASVARTARAAVRGAPAAEAEPQPTLRLELADGEVLSARPVPLAHESEDTMLLTRDGYIVVSAEGRVLHRL